MPVLSRAVQKISRLKQINSTPLKIADIPSKLHDLQNQTDEVTPRQQRLLFTQKNAAHLGKRDPI